MYRELAQYVAPKRKALEHGETGGHVPPVFVIDIGAPPQADGTMARNNVIKLLSVIPPLVFRGRRRIYLDYEKPRL
jgi:hypothetical protein